MRRGETPPLCSEITGVPVDGANRGIRHATDQGEMLPRVREIGVRCVAHPVVGAVTDRARVLANGPRTKGDR